MLPTGFKGFEMIITFSEFFDTHIEFLRENFVGVKLVLLHLFKGTVSQDFLLLVFSWISFPTAQSIPLGPFWFFSKICGDIRNSRCTTGGKFATGINDTGGKFAAGVDDIGGNLPSVSTAQAENLQKIGTISGCWEVNKKEKCIYKLTLLLKDVQTK